MLRENAGGVLRVIPSGPVQANQVEADVASRAGINVCRSQQTMVLVGAEQTLGRSEDALREVGVVLSGHCLGPSW